MKSYAQLQHGHRLPGILTFSWDPLPHIINHQTQTLQVTLHEDLCNASVLPFTTSPTSDHHELSVPDPSSGSARPTHPVHRASLVSLPDPILPVHYSIPRPTPELTAWYLSKAPGADQVAHPKPQLNLLCPRQIYNQQTTWPDRILKIIWGVKTPPPHPIFTKPIQIFSSESYIVELHGTEF